MSKKRGRTYSSGRRKKNHIFRRITAGILLVLVAVVLTFGYSMIREFFKKDTEGTETVKVTIEKGESTFEVASALQDKDIIRYRLPFLAKVRLTGHTGKIRYGTYSLHDGMSLKHLVETLCKEGEWKDQHTFVIPEGDTIARAAKRLEDKDFMTRQEFFDALDRAQKTFAFRNEIPADSDVLFPLEGYLYPDTYYIDEETTPDMLAREILDTFEEKFGQERIDRAQAMGLSVEELLTRASMVQKETEVVKEYPMVAGVIQNRLDQKMKLQFDSTIVYAVTRGMYGKERVLYSDLKVDSPYNTYIHSGVPPTPICNPGLEAIDGVLHPDQNDYLFFQYDSEKNDGTNLYFRTYEEHSSAAETATTDKVTIPAATAEKRK